MVMFRCFQYITGPDVSFSSTPEQFLQARCIQTLESDRKIKFMRSALSLPLFQFSLIFVLGACQQTPYLSCPDGTRTLLAQIFTCKALNPYFRSRLDPKSWVLPPLCNSWIVYII